MQEKEKSTPYSRQGLGSVPWLALLTFTMVAPSLLFGAAAPDWVVGDVFVGIGGGQYQVWHSDDPANPSQKPYQYVQTISDGLGGATAGCAFDSAYRFFGTNFTNTIVDQYSIDFPSYVTQILQPVPQPPITLPAGLAGQFTTGNGTSTGNKSIVFDALGSNFFVGHAGGSKSLELWTRPLGSGSYQLAHQPWTPQLENGGVDWIDVASNGTTIYYTSAGRKIFTFNTAGAGTQGLLFADLGQPGLPNYTLFALRILPNGDVLVADKKNIKRVKAGGAVVKTYDASGQDDWEVLNLDPNGISFWAGDATTHKFYRFNIATGAVEAGPYTPTGAGASLGGICVDGSFSAAQPQPDTLAGGQLLTSASNTITLTAGTTGTVFKATLAGLANDVKVTVRHTLVNPVVAQSDPTVFSLNPGTDRITSPIPAIGNMPCDTALPDSGDGTQGKCEVFEFEVNPTVDLNTVTENIQICPKGSDCTGNPTDFNGTASNPRLLRNLDEDITSGINTYPLSGGRNCVFTVNQQGFDLTDTAHSCGFQSPVQGQNFTKTAGSSIPFKFTAITGNDCQHGPFLSGNSLQPLLMITRLLPPAAPTAQKVIVKGNSGGPPLFIFSGQTWQLQVDTSNLPIGNYLATVIDLNNVIPAFGVNFSLN